jgi:hypothetical protein
MSATLDGSVRAALRTVVAAMVGLPPVMGFENVLFQPAADVAWIREARLSPLPRLLADIGSTNNHIFAEYLYEIHVGAPRDEGPEDLDAFSGVILSGLRTGMQFVVEGQPVRITRAARSGVMYPDSYPGHAVLACTFTMSTYALNT